MNFSSFSSLSSLDSLVILIAVTRLTLRWFWRVYKFGHDLSGYVKRCRGSCRGPIRHTLLQSNAVLFTHFDFHLRPRQPGCHGDSFAFLSFLAVKVSIMSFSDREFTFTIVKVTSGLGSCPCLAVPFWAFLFALSGSLFGLKHQPQRRLCECCVQNWVSCRIESDLDGC